MKSASFEGLDNVKPDVALDAVHKALIRLYALNGTNAAETKVLPRRRRVSKGVIRTSKLPSSSRGFTFAGEQISGNTQSSRLASSILAEIQSAEGRAIQDLSREQLNRYTGVLSGLVEKKMQIGSAIDRESVKAVRHKLEAVKY